MSPPRPLPIMATIVIYTSGTLGDHLPFIALGQELTNNGHRVRLAINQAMHPYANRFGLEAIALSDIERGPEQARANAWAWDYWHKSSQGGSHSSNAFNLERFLCQARELTALCQNADLLISTSIRTLGFIVNNALEIPWLTVSMNPYTFWQPGTSEEQEAKRRTQLTEYDAFKPVLSQAFRELGIKKPIPPWTEGWLFAKHVILASSPHFSHPDLNQLQLRSSIDMTGFWFYEDPAWKDWQPDETLSQFCDRNPIVLSFSSQPLENPRQVLDIHVKSAARLNRPLLIQRGWAGFSDSDLPSDASHENIMFADFLSHDWLFARASCSIQHGGIGSIARAFQKDCPLLIEPYGNDQIYNASRVSGNLKVGAAMHPYKMTVEGLTRALEEKVLTSDSRDRAREIGEKIRNEKGLENACQLIETYLAQQSSHNRISDYYAPYQLSLQTISQTHQVDITEIEQGFQEIPKIIHQTWKDAFIPPGLSRFQNTWKKHHPDWIYLLWTDEDNRKFIQKHYPWFLRIYDSYPEHIMRVDAVRYFLLYHYGGVYVDLDFECIKPIDPLLEGKQVVLGTEPDAQMDVHLPLIQPFQKMLCNAFMASRAKHPFFEHVLKQLIVYRRAPNPLDTTGPFFLTRAHNDYRAHWEIEIVSDDLLYPVTIVENQTKYFLDPVERGRIAQKAYGIHHWSCTWWQDSMQSRAKKVNISILSEGEFVEKTSLMALGEYRSQLQQLPDVPKVSCLMITQNNEEVIRRSIHCFQRQTYPQKELIIVDVIGYETLTQWIEELKDERIVYLQAYSGEKSQDEILEITVAQARGEYIGCWDMWELSEPSRLEVQMAAIFVMKIDGCLLERQQFWWPEKGWLIFSKRCSWQSSLVCVKGKLLTYLNNSLGKIGDFGNELIKSCHAALIDYPQLLTTMFDKENHADTLVWEDSWQGSTDFFEHEVYEIIVQNIQNDLGIDLSPWLGQQIGIADAQSKESFVSESVPEDFQPVIPQILHQTWKDTNIPKDLEAYQRTWQKHHPDWMYCLWNDAEIREFIRLHYAWFLPIYDQYPEHIMRVDAVRYFILNHYGGVYIDLDIECLQPVDTLLTGQQLVFGLEPRRHLEMPVSSESGLTQIVCNAFMASVAGHPFWEHLFKQLISFHKAPGPLDATGPFMLTRAYESYLQQETITLVSSDLIYPVDSEKPWSELDPAAQARITDRAYAIHHWMGSWWRESVSKQTPSVKVSLIVRGESVSVSTIQIEQIKTLLSQQTNRPKLSCLMVTKNRPLLAERAIHCFKKQSYKNRELVIIDDDEDDTLAKLIERLDDERIVHFRLPSENKPLGVLRNIALERSSGSYITQWDDDDLSDPDRLFTQLAVLHAMNTDACFLERQQMWWPKSNHLAISCRRIWEGSFICDKAKLSPYPAQTQGEDTPVIEHLVKNGRIALVDMPQLYTYIYHGENTFDDEHWEAHRQAATESYEGDMYEIKLRELQNRLQIDLSGLKNHPRISLDCSDDICNPESIISKVTSPEKSLAAVPVYTHPKVLILTPVKDAVSFLPQFLENLRALTYPHDRLSLAFLESDSIDGTDKFIEQLLPEMRAKYTNVNLYKRDYGYHPSTVRWDPSQQFQRRSIMAKSRNFLLSQALQDEEWVLWIDADVARWPDDVIERLLSVEKDIVVPHCISERTNSTYDYNTFKLKPDEGKLDRSPYIEDDIYQPPRGYGRLYLSDLMGNDCVEVDGVGGAMLLIRADLHREGLIFPPFSYKSHIETEGLALMAKQMGYQSWGLPNLEIHHP